jgi:hypothetical protein
VDAVVVVAALRTPQRTSTEREGKVLASARDARGVADFDHGAGDSAATRRAVGQRVRGDLSLA